MADMLPIVASSVPPSHRPQARGKFLFAGTEKVYVRGVVYGAFRPDAAGREYQDQDGIERDFALMRAYGFNAVRIPHTTPPRSLLDAAQRNGLLVMVGLSAEQYLGFLIDRKKSLSEIETLVRSKVRDSAGHPALLCYALGNEIPASIARWLGRQSIERYLEKLYRAVKAEDAASLVTYVNYPTTEYLQLPFLDVLSFNVYLESRQAFEAYLDRLQNLAGNRPLIMSELGLDSLRNGEVVQATSLDWQTRTAFARGSAGAFVFSWTDEWWRGGHDVDDWAFGVTHADRSPKPALATVREAFGEVPFAVDLRWPRISVIVCTYNGARTIRDCLDALERLTYPNYEVIVVDDGSTDTTAAIARRHTCRLIQTENRGLASARNTGLEAATGEIVAYIDDDAYPDPDWLTYLAAAFAGTSHVGVAVRTSRLRTTGAPPSALRALRVGQYTSCSAIAKPSTSPAATWHSARTASRRSGGLIRGSARPATTSTCAGGYRHGTGPSDSARRRRSGTTRDAQFAPTGGSNVATAERRRCSSASGPRSTTAPAM